MIKTFEESVKFHGHLCPGLAIGYKVSKIASELLNIGLSEDEEVVAIVENDSCSVDAIQLAIGCTFGKGNLIFKDYGKNTYTIINRKTEEALRLSIKNSFNIMDMNPKFLELKEKQKNQDISKEEEKLLKKETKDLCDHIINMNNDEIFSIRKVEIEIPKKANIYETLVCEECDESVSEHRIKNHDNKQLCIPCYKKLKS